MCFAITKTKPVSFEWLKNGQRITGQEENVRINSANEASVLVLDPVTVKDSGNYTCSATNIHGTDKYTTALEVKGIFRFFNLLLTHSLILKTFFMRYLRFLAICL